MTDISYYNNEIDKILWNILGDDYFTQDEFDDLVNSVANTIYQYDNEVSIDKLKVIIEFVILNKFKICYIYDNDSILNQVKYEKKSVGSKTIGKNNTNDDEDDDEDIAVIKLSDIEAGENWFKKSPKISSKQFQSVDKVEVATYEDLISHKHDYPKEIYKESHYIRRNTRLDVIKKIPQFEQKSKEWLKQRTESLTATAISVVFDEDPYKHPIVILLDKCGRGLPFVENKFVHHGNKYEQIGTMFYSFRNNVEVGEYGLLQHSGHKFIAASPDGICSKKANTGGLSKLVGRLLEIKFPFSREINNSGDLDGDICPHYYFLQVQTQLYVTEMDECDFLQCKIDEYDSWEDFVKDSNPIVPGLSKTTNLEKGCLIQLSDKKLIGSDDKEKCLYNSKYIYPPKLHMTNEEIEKWISSEIMNYHNNDLSENYMIDRVIYWRLSQVTCNLIKLNKEAFEEKIPLLQQFWDYVLFYRQHSDKLDKLIKFVEKVKEDNSAEIFSYINEDFLSLNKDSKYEPLYQEETEWRKKYNQIKAKKAQMYKKKSYNKYTKFSN
ncbi:hypothetical protein [Acanthamoeba polyphaga mimivirus]|uniref:YqaJ viral recombinase domain-containing protein n=1 Tax=Acanthamoeba polyphaga mimivirus TaxID=212035 RepID=A0A0G2Y0H5_MIMIV|nr:hypothetical protein [Acanthamoeba polyphaga mimivirus]